MRLHHADRAGYRDINRLSLSRLPFLAWRPALSDRLERGVPEVRPPLQNALLGHPTQSLLSTEHRKLSLPSYFEARAATFTFLRFALYSGS
jgi:hypothetical protein